MHRALVIVSVAFFAGASCGRASALRSIGAPVVVVDAGQLPLPDRCTLAFTGPDCCDAAQKRVAAAACVDGEYVCTEGAFCGCFGRPQTFHCADFCGSDAFVSPVCGGAGWVCPPGLIPTSSCPPGTCWGEPGDLCSRPQCVDGRWVCESTDGGTHDPV